MSDIPVDRAHAEAMMPLVREAVKAIPDFDLLVQVDLDTLTPEMLYGDEKIGSPLLHCHVRHMIEMIEGTEEVIDSGKPATEEELRRLAVKKLKRVISDLGCMVAALVGHPEACACDGCEVVSDPVCLECGGGLNPTGYCSGCDEYEYA